MRRKYVSWILTLTLAAGISAQSSGSEYTDDLPDASMMLKEEASFEETGGETASEQTVSENSSESVAAETAPEPQTQPSVETTEPAEQPAEQAPAEAEAPPAEQVPENTDTGSGSEPLTEEEKAPVTEVVEVVETEKLLPEEDLLESQTFNPNAEEEEEVTQEEAQTAEAAAYVAPSITYHDEPEKETEAFYGAGALVSDGGAGELYIAVHGYPVGDLTKNEEKIYRFLRTEIGLNKAAACGVLSNMYFESGFSSIAIGDGGTSLGICQWHAGRCRSLIGWCNAHDVDYRSLDGQLAYLKYELENAYSGVLGYLYGVTDNAEGAYHAGYHFCLYYESPDSVQVRSDARGTYAKNTYYPSNLDKYLDQGDASAKKKSAEQQTAVQPETMLPETTDPLSGDDGSNPKTHELTENVLEDSLEGNADDAVRSVSMRIPVKTEKSAENPLPTDDMLIGNLKSSETGLPEEGDALEDGFVIKPGYHDHRTSLFGPLVQIM